MMIQNIPKEIKLFNANHHTQALFNEICKDQVLKVKVVPDFS